MKLALTLKIILVGGMLLLASSALYSQACSDCHATGGYGGSSAYQGSHPADRPTAALTSLANGMIRQETWANQAPAWARGIGFAAQAKRASRTADARRIEGALGPATAVRKELLAPGI